MVCYFSACVYKHRVDILGASFEYFHSSTTCVISIRTIKIVLGHKLATMDYLRNLPDLRYGYYNLYIKNHTLRKHFRNELSPGEPWAYEKYFLAHINELTDFFYFRWHYSVYISIIYVAIIFGLKHLMSYRAKGFDLRREVIVWNALLSIFSIFGILNTAPEFIHAIRTKGFKGSYTNAEYALVNYRNLIIFENV